MTDKKINIEHLYKLGFNESKDKPKLFYKNIDCRLIIYIDFRDLLQDTFYYYIPKNYPLLEKFSIEDKLKYNKIIIDEFFKTRKKLKIPVDFMNLINCDVCRKYYLPEFCFEDEQTGGYISACSESCFRKLKKEEEEYRVKEMFKLFKKRDKLKCPICKEKPKITAWMSLKYKRHEHHVDYNEDIKILICPSCHAKITFHLDKYPELKKFEPVGLRKEMLEKKKKRCCVDCNSLLEGRQLKFCLKCKKEKKKEKQRKKLVEKRSWWDKKDEKYVSPMLKAFENLSK